LLLANWLPTLAACAAMTAAVGSFPGVAGALMQPPAAVLPGSTPTDPAPGPDEPMRQLAAYTHNAFDSGSDLQEPPPALDRSHLPAARQEPVGTGAVRLPHVMAGGFFVAGRNGQGRLDSDLHATVLAALIAAPSGEIIPPNPPQIPAPPPPTAEQIAPPPPIAAPPPPKQLPPPPPQQEEPPAAVPSPGGANGSGGSGDGGSGDGTGGPGGDGGNGPEAPLPTAPMPPGAVRLSP
jgi:hypothetical protein